MRDLEAGGFFDELLVAALDGALALAEGHDVAVLVGQDLELDVAGALDELLHVEVAVGEGVEGFGGGGLEHSGELVLAADDAHAATAAAGYGFEDDRVAYGLRPLEGFAFGGHDAVGAGEDGDFGLLHGLAGGGFFAHHARDFGRGADEFDVGGAAYFGEVGILAQQAVAGVDGVGTGDLGCGDDGRNVEVAVGGLWGADADGFVGELDVEAVAVGLGVDGDGADAHLVACADDAQGDFSAIGD